MSSTPLLDAITVLRYAIRNALLPLIAPQRAFWLQADQGVARPFVIYQSQDAGGSAVKHLGDYAWQGLVTIRALADTQGAADALLVAVLPGMNSLTATGYSFFVEHERPLVLPPDLDGVWQAGSIYRVGIYK